MVLMSRIRTLKIYATGFGIIVVDARNAKGIASMAPKSVPSTAMAIVWNKRYGTSESPVPNKSLVSG